MNHTEDQPPAKIKYFEATHVRKIIEYIKTGYLAHFNLYKYISSNKQKMEEKKITVFVDKPLEVLPLDEAKYLGKDKDMKEEEEDLVKNFIFLFKEFCREKNLNKNLKLKKKRKKKKT
jgi:hypothetical protein